MWGRNDKLYEKKNIWVSAHENRQDAELRSWLYSPRYRRMYKLGSIEPSSKFTRISYPYQFYITNSWERLKLALPYVFFLIKFHQKRNVRIVVWRIHCQKNWTIDD